MNAPRRSRGVRLTDLDRSKIYRLGFVGRRWEVLGPEDASAASAGTDADGAQGAEPRATYAPRHAAPGPSPDEASRSATTRP